MQRFKDEIIRKSGNIFTPAEPEQIQRIALTEWNRKRLMAICEEIALGTGVFSGKGFQFLDKALEGITPALRHYVPLTPELAKFHGWVKGKSEEALRALIGLPENGLGGYNNSLKQYLLGNIFEYDIYFIMLKHGVQPSDSFRSIYLRNAVDEFMAATAAAAP